MQRSIRHKLIVQAVRTSGRLRIEQLAELTGTSAVTIRRDLADLEARGSLRRTRGGAARAAKFGEDPPYEDAQLKRAVIAAADKRILVATGTKLNQTSNFRFGAPDDLTHLITTHDASDEVISTYQTAGVDVTVL